MRKKAELQ